MYGREKRRVLVVEGDPDTRHLLARLLEREGLHVRTAPDGDVALDAARRWRPELVILDLLLPRLGGDALARAMRQDPSLRAIPVVSTSTSPAHRWPEAAFAHVEKPFRIRQVIAVVRAALGADDVSSGRQGEAA